MKASAGPIGHQARHPIRVAARRTGLTPSVLRAWERRYRVVLPERSRGGQRLYSDRDLERLALLGRAVEGGRSIGRIAGLDREELQALVRQDRRGAAELLAAGEKGGGVEAVLGAAREALAAPDPRILQRTLRRGALCLPGTAMVDRVLTPLIQEVEGRVDEGELSSTAEALAYAAMRGFLTWIMDAGDPGDGAPGMLVLAERGAGRGLSALAAAADGVLAGWRAVVFPSSLRQEELRRSLEALGVGVVVRWAPDAAKGRWAQEVAMLRSLSEDVAVVVVSPGGGRRGEAVEGVGFFHAEDLPELRRRLAELRPSAAAEKGA